MKRSDTSQLVLQKLTQELGQKNIDYIFFCHHYDPMGFVPRSWIQVLAKAGLSENVICILSSSYVDQDSRFELEQSDILLYLHDGIGKCIGSFKKIALMLDSAQKSLVRYSNCNHPWLYLMNDSVLPVSSEFDLLAFARSISSSFCDTRTIVGLTDSFQEYQYHLQSYFLAVSPKVLDSSDWSGFWNKYQPTDKRKTLIHNGELWISKYFSSRGVALHSMFGFKYFLSNSPSSFNADGYFGVSMLGHSYTDVSISTWMWRELLEAGCPFVKKGAFLDKKKGRAGLQVGLLFEENQSCSQDFVFIDDILTLMKTRMLYAKETKSNFLIRLASKMSEIIYLLESYIIFSLSRR